MPGFKFTDLMNTKSRLETEFNGSDLRDIWLSPYDVIPSKDNFYSQEQIEELADVFLLTGQQQPTVLGRVNGEYRICSGHRRNKANIYNIERGSLQPDAKVRYLYKDMSEAMFQLQLLVGNAFNRKLSEYEEMEQAEQLKIALKRLRSEDGVEITGTLRNIIADLMDTTPTQIARMSKVSSAAIPEIKEEFKKGNISLNQAYEASRMPHEEQAAIVETSSDRGIQNQIKVAKAKKSSEKRQDKEPQKAEPVSEAGQQENVSKMDILETQESKTFSQWVYETLTELWNVRDFIKESELHDIIDISLKCRDRMAQANKI